MARELCQMWLTCDGKQEADRISRALLEARLIVCARQMPVTSDYWWKGQLDRASEVTLVMESATDLFDIVEELVRNLHTYDIFVLQALPLSHVSKAARIWIESELVKLDPPRASQRKSPKAVSGAELDDGQESDAIAVKVKHGQHEQASKQSKSKNGVHRITVL